MAELKLVDVSMRDGNQCLWSMTGLSTAQMLQAAPLMERVGFKAVDFTSSTHMAVAVRYHREDPWQRIRLLRQALPGVPLQFISTGFRFISWETADAEFMRLAYRCLLRAGIGRFVLLDPMHDMDALLAVARIVKEEGEAENMAALTFTLSEVHDDAFYAACARRIAASPHFDSLYIKDPSGLLTPERARTLIPAVKREIGALPLELHSHTTIGLSQFNYLVGAELGIDALHVAVGPLANGSSLPCARQTLANLRVHGHSVDVDEQALARLEDYYHALARAEGLPAGQPQAYDAAYTRHQVAGGVLSTTRRQLAEVKLEHQFDAVMAEVERVRAELGSPIMVTPFPQIVATQALLNVIGAERYGQVPDQVIRYVLGRFGRPTAPVDPQVLDRIHALPRTREIQGEPVSMTLKERRARFPASLPDEEFLLRAVMPAEQVDAMRARTPAELHYNPSLAPVLRLLRELKTRPALAQLRVEKADFSLELLGSTLGQSRLTTQSGAETGGESGTPALTHDHPATVATGECAGKLPAQTLSSGSQGLADEMQVQPPASKTRGLAGEIHDRSPAPGGPADEMHGQPPASKTRGPAGELHGRSSAPGGSADERHGQSASPISDPRPS